MRKTTTHTPGPWEAFKTPSGYAIDNGTKMVAKVPFTDAEASHDAALIAAAPDLLTAGRALIDAVEFCCGGEFKSIGVAVEMMERAIAKAKGRA